MLQKTLKVTQMERDILLKRIENDKLIKEYSSDNNDVSIYITVQLEIIQ